MHIIRFCTPKSVAHAQKENKVQPQKNKKIKKNSAFNKPNNNNNNNKYT